MCGDHCSRTPTVDSGDLVAIIHPSSQQRSIFAGGRLHLSNRLPGSTVSTLNCRHHHHHYSDSMSSQDSAASSRAAAAPPPPPVRLSVRIHQSGQPLLLFNSEAANPVLHSFAISPPWGGAGTAADESCCLVGRRLNLGVGGDGIVGRTVSLVDERAQVVLGEGVIGWI
ncbi:hypothetical protein DV738_g159, partial [Chaetothyriales sp. CBS 135597]